MHGLELYKLLQEHFPNEAAMSWDNVGLLCGRMDREIKKIYVTLDADTRSVDEAIRVKADLILTHHPMIFSSIKRVEEGDYVGERIIKILENHLSCYAMHTNYDVKRMAILAAERMEMKNLQVLEPTTPDGKEGIGFTGDLECPVTVREYGMKIKKWFQIPDIRIFGDLDQRIDRVSICPGSAKGMEELAIAQGGQVLIGGDFGHHDGIDCVEKHIAVIDAGHYGMEHIFIEDMCAFLAEHCPDIEVVPSPIIYPFVTL